MALVAQSGDQMTGAWVLMNVSAEFRPLLLEGDAQIIGSAVVGWAESGLTVRVVRGRKMRTLGGVFDEFSAALQFPLYFGENCAAFDECIADLEALPAGKGYVMIFTEPDHLLADAEDSVFVWLVGSLEAASTEWSQAVERGEWWDRPAVPFHVVLAGQGDPLALAARRWSLAGSEPLPLK